MIKVFYTLGQSDRVLFDPDFKLSFEWDIPLLAGYEYTFVKNASSNAGTRRFRGIINPTLTAEIEEWKADAILVIGWSFESHLKVIRYFKGRVPVLFRGDSNLIDEPVGFSLKKTLRRLFLTWVYSYVDYALYVGSANRQYYLANGMSSDRLISAPHAIDNERFSKNSVEFEAKARKSRENLGIRNEIVFLFAAKLIPKKAPELLIDAFLESNISDARLIIIGNGELESKLKNKYKTPAVIFLNFQNQAIMPVVYRIADVFCLPSIGPGETWGLAVNEAMACSKAILVSSKAGCAADLVRDGQNGYIFTSGDQKELSSKITKLSAQKHLLKKMGQMSSAMISEWSYFQIGQAIRNVLAKQ